MPLPRSVRRDLLYQSRYKIFRLLNRPREKERERENIGVHLSTSFVIPMANFIICVVNLGHFHTDFFDTCVSIEIFDALLSKAEDRIQKQSTNWRRSISPEERVVVTIR
jgi:hypothetical protein